MDIKTQILIDDTRYCPLTIIMFFYCSLLCIKMFMFCSFLSKGEITAGQKRIYLINVIQLSKQSAERSLYFYRNCDL